MAGPEDMILPLLREMRAENAALHEKTREILADLDRRLGDVEERQVSFRQALSGDSLLSKLVTGDFEERIQALDERMRVFEGRP